MSPERKRKRKKVGQTSVGAGLGRPGFNGLPRRSREAAKAGRASPAPTTVGDSPTQSRVVVEAITPQVDGGRFPIKRTVGDTVVVEADVFADGHDNVAAVLKYRRTERAQRAREGAERGEWAPASDRAGVWGGAPRKDGIHL